MSGPRTAHQVDLVTAVRRHAEAHPHHPALTWLTNLAESTAKLTFGALDDAAAAVAAALLAHAEPGDRVLLVHPPGLDFVTAFVGSLYAGCVPVPVYPLLDTDENVAKVRRVLDDSGAALVWVSDESVADHVARTLAVPSYWATGAGRHRPDREPEPDALAFLQYTSGSTADPRGVMVTHGNLAANLGAIRSAFEHDAGSVVLSWLPAYHDMGLIGNILHPLHTGCRCYLGSPIDFIRRPLSWLTAVDRFGITTSGAPNFAYDLVVKAAGQEGLPEVDLSRWRTAYCGAEPVSARTLGRFADLLAPQGFRHDALVACYGLAEATLLVTSAPVGGGVHRLRSPDGQQVVSCGVAQDCEVAIVDAAGDPVADGEVGEIVLSGRNVAAGYFNRPDDSRRTFGATVPGRAGAWLRTGDLGFLDGGELFVTGRTKDLIVVRGRNHHPQDLERLVAETSRAIRPGCVAAFVAPGGDGAVVVAELRGDRELTEADRLAVAAAAASSFGLALREIVAVPRGAVPKTTSGKLRRGECRARYLAGCYDEYRVTGEVAPAGPGADAVRAAVRAVLGAGMPDDEPLVARGLDSLQALRLAELLARRTGVDIPVRTLLRGATIADVATMVSEERPAAAQPKDDDGRLSKAQESLLFLHMLDPASDEYAISFAWQPWPDTDLAAFDEALRRALSWQPELAMRIAADGSGWRRVPVEPGVMRDATALAPIPITEDRLDEQLAAAAALPFELDKGPLLRLYLWQTPARRVYQLVVHHMVTDLWSLSLVLRDIATCYADILVGRSPAPPLAAPYGSYVREQEAYLASAAARKRDEELRALLPTRARPVDIRTDKPYPARRSARAGRVSATVPASRTPADPVALMIALWAATLHRYGTPSPVVVGVPVTGRPHGRHGTIVGLCANTVPIALEVDRDLPLARLVAATRDQLERGVDAGLYPLVRAVEAVRPERTAGRQPLVETLLTVQENPMPDVPGLLDAMSGNPAELVLGPLSLRTVPVPRRTCRYDLDLVVTPSGGGFLLALDYAADLFTSATAESVLATFQATLDAALADPDANLAEVLSAPDADLLARISAHDAGQLEPAPLARIRRAAADDPDRPAIETTSGTWGYGEFVARMDRVAAAVRCADPPCRHAAVLAESPADFAVAMFGAWSAGAGILPLPVDYPNARLAHMLADRAPHVLLTTATLAPRARHLAGAIPVVVLDDIPADPVPAPPDPPADAPAFTVYTSGSTGTPKGVPIRHDQISPLIAWSERKWGLGPWARIAQTLSLGFDFGLQELFTILPTAGCVVVPDPADRRNARDYARFLRRARISVLFTTPSYATELAVAGERLPDLRLVLLGGEVLRRATVAGLRALVGSECRLFNGYGPTEATVNCLMYEIPWSVPDLELPEVLPVGTATAASRIHLVDRADRPVPVGAVGEIVIGGRGVADGYLGRPDLTAERFERLDLDPGMVYRTGDLAYVTADSGYVVVGRADRQVKVRGFRVEPSEVEHVLLGAPGVRSAAVRVFGDPGDLTAFLVGEGIDLDAVTGHAAQALPPAMMPSRMVPLDRLPTTPNGKLDENALADAAARLGPRPLPATASPAEIETAVCEIWAAALSMSTVDSKANVFDLGAHSLIVTRVHNRLQASVGVTFPVHDIFEHPRPRDLARCISLHRRSASTAGPGTRLSTPNSKVEQ